MQHLISGTLLHGGTYKIEKVLGQGSFGITYLAEHTSLGKKYAIKEFFMRELNSRGEDGSITGMSDSSLSYNYAQKFRKEAQNLAQMEHPNIVNVTDSFEENGTYYYVMEYIEGTNLNDYIKQYHPSEKKALEIIRSVAEALIYMHEEKHVLHLDLKPGNIMRRKGDGHIFLIDFGLSKHYSNDGQPETSTTIGLGTVGYAPIEQANQAKGGEFRPTIDVYALGATLYKLLTGQTPPIASDLVSDDELLVEKMKEKNISKPLIDFVVKAMLPNVKKRIQTVRGFKELLSKISQQSTSSPNTTITNSGKIVLDDEENIKEETEVITSKAIQNDKTDFEKFETESYNIPSYYISNIDDTLQNASSGNVDAMLALGFIYLRGEGVPQNSNTAYYWFTHANSLGDCRAKKIVAEWMQIKDRYVPKSRENTSVSSSFSTGNKNTILSFLHKNSKIITSLLIIVMIFGNVRTFLNHVAVFRVGYIKYTYDFLLYPLTITIFITLLAKYVNKRRKIYYSLITIMFLLFTIRTLLSVGNICIDYDIWYWDNLFCCYWEPWINISVYLLVSVLCILGLFSTSNKFMIFVFLIFLIGYIFNSLYFCEFTFSGVTTIWNPSDYIGFYAKDISYTCKYFNFLPLITAGVIYLYCDTKDKKAIITKQKL